MRQSLIEKGAGARGPLQQGDSPVARQDGAKRPLMLGRHMDQREVAFGKVVGA